MKRKLSLLVLAVFMLVPAMGIAQAQDEEPIRVGLLSDLSGWLSLYGVEQVNGFQLGLLYAAGIDPMEYDSIEEALEEVTVAGRSIEVIVADYGSESPAADADNAAAAARELIESEFVDIIFGTPNSGAAIQVQELVKPDNYDLIFMAGPAASPSITSSGFNVNTFRVCRSAAQDALALTSVADQFGTSYIQIAVDTDFGRGTAEAFQASLAERGIEAAGDVIYIPTDITDFTPYIQQIIDSGADFVNPILAGGPITLWNQQSEELGLLDSVTVLTGTNSNDGIAAAPPPAGGVAFIVYQYTLPETEINDWLTENHIAVFQDVPDLFTECGFATAQALYMALEATEGDPFPEAMIPALEGMMFEGPKGEYTIRASDHQALMPQYIVEFLGVEEVAISDDVSMMLPLYEMFAEISAEDAAPACALPEDLADRCE
jgi:branched-chain amino acid transport system substrate-binding protein